MSKFLVTAGPTREAIDPVRYVSNRSSGRMGYAICEALLAMGHEVVLVTGPTSLSRPRGAQIIEVESALEMLDACESAWSDCDGLFAVAAVGDYRPANYTSQKLKRVSDNLAIEMVANPDIVKTLATSKGDKLVVGFALESENGVENSRNKLASKNLDYICLNSPDAQGALESSLDVISVADRFSIGPCNKSQLAEELIWYLLIKNEK